MSHKKREYFIIFKILTLRAKDMGYHKEINLISLKPLRHANDQQTSGIANQKTISSMSGTILILTETLFRSPANCYVLNRISLPFMRLSLVRRRTVPVSGKLHELCPELQSPPTRPIV